MQIKVMHSFICISSNHTICCPCKTCTLHQFISDAAFKTVCEINPSIPKPSFLVHPFHIKLLTTIFFLRGTIPFSKSNLDFGEKHRGEKRKNSIQYDLFQNTFTLILILCFRFSRVISAAILHKKEAQFSSFL